MLNEVIPVDPNPVWQVSLQEEEIRTQTHTHRDHVKTQAEDSHLQVKVLEGTNPANTWISDIQPPELWENKFLLFNTISLWYFIMVALAA